MQAAIPHMRTQGGGVIVNVSSGTTQAILPGVAPYSSTKHALNNLSLVARAELAPDHIRVSVVYPFITDTDFARNAVMAGEERRQAGPLRGDPPEYAAGLILEAIETGATEVYAEQVRRLSQRG